MSLEQLKQEFDHLMNTGDAQEIRQFLDDQNISDIAELVYEYEEHEASIIANMAVHRAAGVFKILESPTQRRIIETLPPSKTAELLNELPADDRTSFLEDLRMWNAS
jgi:magnesium transporter